jgi:hypothetical protein
MMGSRGVDSSPQVGASATLDLLLTLMGTVEPKLRALIDELKEQELRCGASAKALEAVSSDHDKREAEVLKRERELDVAQAAMKDREARCATTEADTAKRQATFDAQQAALTARAAMLDDEAVNITKDQLVAAEQLRVTRQKATDEILSETAAMDQRKTELAKREDALAKREAALNSSVARKIDELAAQARDLKVAEDAAASLKAEYTAKLATLRQLAA